MVVFIFVRVTTEWFLCILVVHVSLLSVCVWCYCGRWWCGGSFIIMHANTVCLRIRNPVSYKLRLHGEVDDGCTKCWTVTSEVSCPDSGDQGLIILWSCQHVMSSLPSSLQLGRIVGSISCYSIAYWVDTLMFIPHQHPMKIHPTVNLWLDDRSEYIGWQTQPKASWDSQWMAKLCYKKSKNKTKTPWTHKLHNQIQISKIEIKRLIQCSILPWSTTEKELDDLKTSEKLSLIWWSLNLNILFHFETFHQRVDSLTLHRAIPPTICIGFHL